MIKRFSNWAIKGYTKPIKNLGINELPQRFELQKYNDFLKESASLKMSSEEKETLIRLDCEYGFIYAMRNLDYNREVINLDEEKDKFFKHLYENNMVYYFPKNKIKDIKLLFYSKLF